MPKPLSSPGQEIVGSLVGRLRYPWLVALLGALFLVDLVIPDPIPFIDEMMLALLTFLVGAWGARKKRSPEVVDVTPAGPGGEKPPSEPGG